LGENEDCSEAGKRAHSTSRVAEKKSKKQAKYNICKVHMLRDRHSCNLVILSAAKNLAPRAFSCLCASASTLPRTNTRGTRSFAALRMTRGSGFAYISHRADFAYAMRSERAASGRRVSRQYKEGKWGNREGDFLRGLCLYRRQSDCVD
jgi:hypothetical protein